MSRRRRVRTELSRRKLRTREPLPLAVRWSPDAPPPVRRPPSAKKLPAPSHACPTCGRPCVEVARQLSEAGRLFCTVQCRCGYLRVLELQNPEGNP